MPETQSTKDEALIKELLERFDYCYSADEPIREQARLDMQCMSVDGPWDSGERKAREDAGRPCEHFDQITQHRNKLVNEVRLNKRAVTVSPMGASANDETAELRSDRIRQIEYESNAQQAYQICFENVCDRGYGSIRVTTDYISETDQERMWDMKVRIKLIQNPDSVYYDPDTKDYYDPDGKNDAQYVFVIDTIPRKEFASRFPDAEVTSFTSEHSNAAPRWIQSETVQIAEYWRKEKTQRTAYRIDDGSPKGMTVYKEDLEKGVKVKGGMLTTPEGAEFKVISQRKTHSCKVVQYLTNGVEILERNEWPGKWIPIVPMFGIERWVTYPKESSSKRELLSFVRMARSAQKAFDYAATSELEELGRTPKVPYLAIHGQLEGYEQFWADINKVPRGYLYYHAKTDETGENILPPPIRNTNEPAIQGFELAKGSYAMAIQNALGSASVERKDRVAQSAKALEAIDRAQDLGSFHFIDNYDRCLQHVGRNVDYILDKVEDTPRDVGLRSADDSFKVTRINDPEYKDPVSGKQRLNEYGEGDHHEEAISTGPHYQTMQEEASAFADLLMQSPDPLVQRSFAPIAIKLKNLGPLGDEMEKIAKALQPPEVQKALSPDEEMSPEQAKAMLAQMQQQLQQASHAIQQLQFEKQAKVVESQARLEDTKVKTASSERESAADNETAKQIAQMNNMIKLLIEKMDAEKQAREMGHEAGMTAVGHHHESHSQERQLEEARDSQTRDHDHAREQHQQDLMAAERSQEREIESRPKDTGQ